jgi:hypothetical protein
MSEEIRVDIGFPADTISLPVTLPTLRVAWLMTPKQLSVAEFDYLIVMCRAFRDALTKQHQP